MRLFAVLALIVATLAVAPAQAQPSAQPMYGKLWFFNYTDKAVRLTFTDGRHAMDIPAGRTWTTPIPAGVFDFVVKTEGLEDLKESHLFEKGSSFANVGGEHWVCMILDVPRGEYYRPRLSRLDYSRCESMMTPQS